MRTPSPSAAPSGPLRVARRCIRWIRRLPVTVLVAAIVLAVIIAVAVAAPLLIPYSPLEQDILARNMGPSWKHLLGTDQIGRDIYSRVVVGSRNTVMIAAASTILTFLIGAGVGLLAMASGKVAETVVFAFIDLVRALPAILLALLLVVALGTGTVPLILALGISFAPFVAYVARATYMREASSQYVKSARTFGGGRLYILWQHIMPNLIGALVTQAAIILPRCIVTESVLSFLGVGSSPEVPTWGRMISDSSKFIQIAPFMIIPPVIALVLLTASISVVGDYVRRWFDPIRGEASESDAEQVSA